MDIDEVVLSVFVRMMDEYERQVADFNPASLVEVRYDELDNEPIETIGRIYSSLNLPGFSNARGAFEAYLSSVKTFKKNEFAYSDEAARKVENRLGRFIEKWGYERPNGGVGGASQQKSAKDDDESKLGENAA